MLYDASGEMMARFNEASGNWDTAPFRLGHRMLGTYDFGSNVTHFLHANALGSSTVITDGTGSVVNEQLFYPWGTLWEDTSQSEFHFAAFDWGYLTPGILPTPNRMYSYGKGRWMTPDPAGLAAGDASNPKSLNRYSYVMNNPTSLIDPSGLDPVPCPPGSPPGEICIQVNGNPLPGGFDGGGIGGGARQDHNPARKSSWLIRELHRGGCGGSAGDGGSAASNNSLKQKVCSAIPSGRTTGASGGLGGVGSPGAGGELVVNYSSGQVSAFGFVGFQVGWNGGASGSVYSGFVYGLNNSNSNYSGGFTGVNGGAGLGGFLASSSGGLTGGTSRLVPNGAVKVGGVSFGGGLVGGFSGGVTATSYSSPTQLGKYWAFTPLDWLLYAATQVCK
jgi:RHS repeat-associated protein